MKLFARKGLNSVEEVRTRIFYYAASFTAMGGLSDIILRTYPNPIITAGYIVISFSLFAILLKTFNLINSLWANFIIIYLLLFDGTSTLYFLIGDTEFFSYFIRMTVLICIGVPYAGFTVNKYHSIIIGIFYLTNYIVLSYLTEDKYLIQGIFVITIIVTAYIIGIYLLVHNLFLFYNIKKDLLEKAEESNLALRKRKEELKEAIESKNALFSIISHDLRNPFNTIIGFNDLIDIALKKNDIEQIRKYHPLIKRSTENAFNLINNLFNWAKAHQENIQFVPNKFVYEKVVTNVINLLSSDAKKKNITIKTSIPQNHIVVADNNMIDVVVRNLLTNAIKFTPENGEITIGVESRENQINYFVKDNGIGTTEEKIKDMSSGEPVESKPGTMNEKGSGLGLSICKGFIEKHHGKLWAERNESQGLTIYFTIG